MLVQQAWPVGRISQRRNPPTAAPEQPSGGLRSANPPYALKKGRDDMYCSMPTPAQIPAARVLRDWMQTDLVEAPGVPEISVKNIERGATHPRVRRPACFASIPA